MDDCGSRYGLEQGVVQVGVGHWADWAFLRVEGVVETDLEAVFLSGQQKNSLRLAASHQACFLYFFFALSLVRGADAKITG